MELSIAILVMGVIAGVVLKVNQSGNTGLTCYESTQAQLDTILTAMDQFVNKNDRLPLPAERTAGVEDTNYGREASGGALDSIAGVTYGSLPFQALGLSPSYAGDCWSNKFTYVVTTNLTSNAKPGGYPDPNIQGRVQIRSDATKVLLNDAAYAIISHGANGNGAVKLNYRNASDRGWCNDIVAVSSSLESMNCGAGSNIIVAAEYNDGKNGGANLFDDVVIYKGKLVKSVNGICSATVNSCLAGTVSNFVAGACGTTDTWTCLGAAGGSNASCSLANAACPPPPPPAPPPAPAPCDPMDPFGGCYSPPPTPGPGPGPFVPPPTPGPGPVIPTPGPTPGPCDPMDPMSACYVPPPTPPAPCDPMDPMGACYTPPPPPPPTPSADWCCQPYWDLGFQCPDSCVTTPPPSPFPIPPTPTTPGPYCPQFTYTCNNPADGGGVMNEIPTTCASGQNCVYSGQSIGDCLDASGGAHWWAINVYDCM